MLTEPKLCRLKKMSEETNYKKRAKIIRVSFLIVVLLIGLWVFGLIKYVDNLPTQKSTDESVTDGIVIFTGGIMRLEAGIELLTKEKAKRLFVSGVGERTRLDVLLILSGKLPDNILELKERIDLGYEAKNTRGNAVEVARWVKENNYKSLRLVTANYHMPRSYYELSTEMPEIRIIQSPVFPGDIKMNRWWESGVTKKVLVSEYSKYLVRRFTVFLGI